MQKPCGMIATACAAGFQQPPAQHAALRHHCCCRRCRATSWRSRSACARRSSAAASAPRNSRTRQPAPQQPPHSSQQAQQQQGRRGRFRPWMDHYLPVRCRPPGLRLWQRRTTRHQYWAASTTSASASLSRRAATRLVAWEVGRDSRGAGTTQLWSQRCAAMKLRATPKQTAVHTASTPSSCGTAVTYGMHGHFHQDCPAMASPHICSTHFPTQAFTCRLCHDEACSHRMDRYRVRHMLCMECGLQQPVAQTCSRCETQLAHYYCSICHLFDGDPSHDIYHCPFCNVCRWVAAGTGRGRDAGAALAW